jgi:Ion channel
MSDDLQTQSGTKSLRRFTAAELLLAITALFVLFPFIENLHSATLIESILLTIVLVSAVAAISGRGKILAIAIVLALPALAGRWINHYRPDLLPPEVFLVSAIVVTAFVIANLLRFVLAAPSVNTEVLCAGIAAYMLLALLWMFGYWLVAELVPDAFAFNASIKGEMSIKGFDGLYFSIITLCTVGYGDISPVSKVARMLAAMEAITGPLYLAVLIARLVTLRSTAKTS